MLTRRRLLQTSAGLIAAGAMQRASFAQSGRPFTFVSWGGALSDLEKTALLDPYAAKNGFQITHASPTNYAKLKAMVTGGQLEWDMVDVGGRFVFQGRDQGLLEQIDYSMIPNAKNLDPSWAQPYGVYTTTGATVIAWNTTAFPAGKGPKNWKDFWNVKDFPGARGLYKPFYYNYEAALLAAGLKFSEIYPVTDDKVKQAMDMIQQIKPHVKVWWTAGAQPPQLLSSGELAISSAWNGRILAGEKDGAPIAMTYNDGLAWGNAWVVVKGTPHKETAMKLINYAISEEAQMGLLSTGTYGPVLASAAAKATPEQQRLMVSSPENVSRMLILNEEQAALYSAKYEDAWNKLQLG